jgi:sugar phosphate isomerase/epimerase
MTRQFTSLFTVLFLASSLLAQDKPQVKAPVGLQLYSLRTQFQAEGVAKTLDRVKAMGFKYVELAGTYNLPADKFKAMLDERGLVAISGHFPYDRFKNEPDKVAAEAKALGLQAVGTAWISHTAPFTEAAARDAIAVFNKAGKVLADANIKFYYHNHGYEFHKHGDATLFDLIARETDPKLVSFEMDLVWVVHPGQDPAALIAKYPDRWIFTHLKDLKKGVPTGDLSGKTDVRNDVPLGTGQVNFPAFFKAAENGTVKYHFIEDESPTVVDQIPQSLEYLKQFGGKQQ